MATMSSISFGDHLQQQASESSNQQGTGEIIASPTGRRRFRRGFSRNQNNTMAANNNNDIRLPQSSASNQPRTSENHTATASQRSRNNSDSEPANTIAARLHACETIRFPFKKKLVLNSLRMTSGDIPLRELNGTPLGQSLHKLSLCGNKLSIIPDILVTCLPSLKALDLSQCELEKLPETWALPQLRRLNLSHNRLSDFPPEAMLSGIPELQELTLFGNKIAAITIPQNPKVPSRLEILDLGYNDLVRLPDELDRLRGLRILKVMNNFLEVVPERVCMMDLKAIDVSNNPIIRPPIGTCERGVVLMKRYYQCLRIAESEATNPLVEQPRVLEVAGIEVVVSDEVEASPSQQQQPNKLGVWYPERVRSQAFLVELYEDALSGSADVVFAPGTDHDGGGMYRAHKNILAQRCPKLYELVEDDALNDANANSESSETTTPILQIVPIPSVRPEIFKILLDSVYTVEPQPKNVASMELAIQVLHVADVYDRRYLKLLVESVLVDRFLNPRTAATLLILADSHPSCALLKEASIATIQDHTGLVETTPNWSKVEASPKLLRELWKNAVLQKGDNHNHNRRKSNDHTGDIDRMDVTSLREKLRSADLRVDGSREVLVDRWKAFLSQRLS